MKAKLLCDPYIWEKPSILAYTSIFGPNQNACVSEVINHIVLVTLLFGIVGFSMSAMMKTNVPITVCFIGYLIFAYPSLRVAMFKSSEYEAFQTMNMNETLTNVKKTGVNYAGEFDTSGYKGGVGLESLGPVPGGCKPYTPSNTPPSARNPFMNVLIDEYKYKPKRAKALSVLDPSVKITLDDFFRTEFARDPTDVFGRNQSQREFITMPSTSIPNDQESYQNWLYKIPGKTCKEGGREACLPGTDGSAIPWLNVDS
jgi:hypothetical protein